MKNYLLLILLFLVGCSTVPKEEVIKDKEEVILPPVVVQPEQPAKPPIDADTHIKKLMDIGAKSSCAKYNWKDRGVATAGYMKGLPVSYAKSLCRPIPGVSRQPVSNSAGDVLNNYADIFKAMGIVNTGGLETYRNTFAIIIGLGMRESNGNYCAGKDSTMDFSEGDTAEAGIYQTSYNVISANKVAKDIYEAYKKDESKCLLGIYKEGTSKAYCDKNSKTWGTGEGAKYQQLVKRCPALSVDTALTTVRFSGGPKGHYAPLRQKVAEVKPQCIDMLQEVEKYVMANLDVCKAL